MLWQLNHNIATIKESIKQYVILLKLLNTYSVDDILRQKRTQPSVAQVWR